MCWMSNNLKVEIAEKDIPVWKVVDKIENYPEKCRSYYARYIYTKNSYDWTPINLTISNDGHIEGSKGFHSYSNELKAVNTADRIDVIMKCKSSMESPVLTCYFKDKNMNIRIARFFIPKGAKYIKNDVGKIISTAIVFDGFID